MVVILMYVCTIWAFSARADELVAEDESDNGGWVEVEVAPTVINRNQNESSLIPYSNRKYDWGWQIGFGTRAFRPEFFTSAIDKSTYDNAYNVNGNMAELELGFRYNTSAGGFLFNFGFAGGDISSEKARSSGITTVTHNKLEVRQTFAGLKFVIDSFWLEPYVAPYVGGGMASTSYDEKIFTALDGSPAVGSDSGTITGFYYNFGFLFLLNWINWSSHNSAYLKNSVENYYIDIGFSQMLRGNGKVDLGTGPMLTAKIQMEFY